MNVRMGTENMELGGIKLVNGINGQGSEHCGMEMSFSHEIDVDFAFIGWPC